MLSASLTTEISALSRFEKILLIEKISRMLLDEEDPAQHLHAEKQYPIFTPLNQEGAAAQLQDLLKQHKS
ncbi:MAG: hypothetical protein KDE51_05105 [Anaerolineales bacterium]|nr:hypothetical protein [Anaerolineales bacterium]